MAAETEAEAVEFIRSLVSAWDCCGTCAGSILGRRDQRVRAEAAEAAEAEVERLNAAVESLHAESDDECIYCTTLAETPISFPCRTLRDLWGAT